MRKLQFLVVAAAASLLTALAAVAGMAEAQAEVTPANTTPPTISGTARDGDTLTAGEGAWTGTDPITFTYQWQRCDANGLNCANLAGATSGTYAVQTSDVNHRLRVGVTAKNTSGSDTAYSQPTAPVAPPEGATRLADGRYSIPATSVRLPHRLVVSGVEFIPSVLRSRQPYTGRFRVTDTRGYVVRDAIVLVTGVPLGWIQQSPEARTNVDGLVTIQLQPTTRLRLVRGGSMVKFIRARKEGDSLLAGVSTRRLVRVRTAKPAS
ncbi:MAG TPA: hypothetical protein VFO03_12615 [Gaiellaceae bacterium]|nr:hypothetical protein [Gaiellaceae bacterium]